MPKWHLYMESIFSGYCPCAMKKYFMFAKIQGERWETDRDMSGAIVKVTLSHWKYTGK